MVITIYKLQQFGLNNFESSPALDADIFGFSILVYVCLCCFKYFLLYVFELERVVYISSFCFIEWKLQNSLFSC